MVPVIGGVEPHPVDVEAVGVLHGELAGPEQPGPRPGLVAELRLELVPGLRKLLVRAQLRGQRRENLLVGHSQCELRALAVGEPEHLLAHDLPAAAALPDLRRVHVGQQYFLRADLVHLLPDDLDDLGPHPEGERQQRVVPGHELPNVPGAEQQPVARRTRVRRVVPEGRDVHL